MKNIKVITITITVLVLIIGLVIGINKYLDWPVRFKNELNKFFGEDKWELIDEETKDSIIYTKYYSSRNYPSSTEVAGKFKNWYIKYNNNEIWRITNHAYKINNDENFVKKDYPINKLLLKN